MRLNAQACYERSDIFFQKSTFGDFVRPGLRTPTVAWGHRGPLVVGRAWKNFSVKLEVQDAAAVGPVVKSVVVVGARNFGVQLAITAGGRGVQRDPAPTKGDASVGKSAAIGVVCYGCGKMGHLRRDCYASGGSGPSAHPPLRCWGCGAVGHRISFCPGRTLPVVNASGVTAPTAGSKATGRGDKRGGGPLTDPRPRGRPFGGGSVLGYLSGGARRVAAAHQGARG